MKSDTAPWVEALVGTTLEPRDITEVAELDIAVGTGTMTIKLKQEIGETVSQVTKLADPAP